MIYVPGSEFSSGNNDLIYGKSYELVPKSTSYHTPRSSFVQSPSVSYHTPTPQPTPQNNEMVYMTHSNSEYYVMDPMIPGGGYIDFSEYMLLMTEMGEGI